MPETNIADELSAIAKQESGGKYDAIGPVTKSGARALGKYQVMETNLPEWSQKALGREVTPDEFIKSPDLQEQIVQYKWGEIRQKHSPSDAAKVWFGGEGALSNSTAKDVTGTTVQQYADAFKKRTGSVELPDYTAQALKASGYNPTEYTDKINAAFDKGRDSSEYWKAAKSYNDNIGATMPPLNRAQKQFLQGVEKAPVNQVQNSWWDDVSGSFANALTNAWAHTKEAAVGLEHLTGITDENKYGKQINEIAKDQAFQQLRLSPNATKDPLSFNEDGSFNWRGLGSTISGGIGGMVGFTLPFIGSLVADALTETPFPTIALLGMNGLVGAVDVYGTTFEEGKKRGLSNDEASTLGASVGIPSGLLFALPVTSLGTKLMKPATAALTDEAIDVAIKDGLTTKTFQDAMQKSTNGLADALKSKGINYLKTAGQDALAFGSTMFLQNYVNSTAEKLYAHYSHNKDKFQDVINKTGEQEFKDAMQSGVIGGILGGIMAIPALAKPMMEQTAYGYVDANLGAPEKIDGLKQYIAELGQQNNYSPDEINNLHQSIDEMANVAATYGKTVKVPEARFQIFNLLRQGKMNADAIEAANAEVKKQTEGADPAFAAPIIEANTELQGLYAEKKVLIDKYLGEIGDSRKPISYSKYISQAKEINGKISETLNKLYPDAVQEQATTESVLRHQGVQRESQLSGVERQNESIQAAQESPKEEIVPKTVRDLLDVPVTVQGMKGFLSEAENGDLILHSDAGKEHIIASGEEAKQILDSDASEITSVIQDYDHELFNQKINNEKESEKSRSKGGESDGEKTKVEDEGQVSAVETTPENPVEESDLDKYFDEPKELNDEQRQGVDEQSDVINAGITDGDTALTEEAQNLISLDEADANERSTRRGKNKGKNKKAGAEDNGGADNAPDKSVKPRTKNADADTASDENKGSSASTHDTTETTTEDRGDNEALDYAKGEIEKGILNWDGNRLSPRVNLEGIEWKEIRKGEKDILAGKDTSAARKLTEAINAAKEAGGYEYVEGSGKLIRKQFITHEEQGRVTELKAEAEKAPTADEVEELANEYDNLTDEQRKEIEEAFGVDEGAKSQADEVLQKDAAEAKFGVGDKIAFELAGSKRTGEVIGLNPDEDSAYMVKAENGTKHRIAEADVIGRQQKESSLKPISEQTSKFIHKALTKAFGGIKVKFLSGEEYTAKHGDSLAVTNPDGTIDINKAKVTASTQVHEFGHIWNSWAKKYRPELYKKGRELVLADKELMDRVKEQYPELNENQLADEALATLIGEHGAEQIADAPTGIKKFLTDLWQSLKNFTGKRLGKDAFAGMEDMTVGDFSAKIAKELLSGKEISPITSEEISAIEQDGISRYQLQKNEDFKPPVDMTPLHLGNQSTRVAASNFIRYIKSIVGTEKELTDTHVLDLLKTLNKVVKDLIPKLTKNPDGTENIRAGAEYVMELRDDLASDKTIRLLKEIGENVAANEKFTPEELSPEARKLYQTIGRVLVHADRVADIQDKIITDAHNGMVLGNANEAKDLTVEPMKPWREKFEAFRDKNMATKAVANTLEKYVLNTSHLPLFFKSLSGTDTGMWKSLTRSFQQAVGKEFSIKQTALRFLDPLKTDFKDGSVALGNKFEKAEGVNAKEFFNDELKPDIKITNAELAGLYATLQDPQVRAIAFGEDTKGDFRTSFREYSTRPHTDINFSIADWKKLDEHFKGTDIKEPVQESTNYLHSQEAPIFNMLTGLTLPKKGGDGFYYPLIPFEGKDTPNNYMKKNRFIDDISSHKSRSPSGETRYYIGDIFEVMNNRITSGAKYSSFAVPIHNGEVMIEKYAKPFMQEHGMKQQQEYWNKFKYHLSNPEDNIGEFEKKLTQGFVYSAIGLNPFVNLKNLASIPMASSVIRTKYLVAQAPTIAKVFAYMAKNHGMLSADKPINNPLLQEMIDHSDFANLRIHGNNTEAQELAQNGYEINVDTKVLGKDVKVRMKGSDTLKGLKNSDTAMGAGIWEAAKAQIDAEHPYLEKGSDDYWNKVDEVYTEAVTAAQSSMDEVNRSFYSKGGFAEQRGTINRVLSLFAGQQFAQFNMFADRALNLINNPTPSNRNQFAKAFMNVFMVNALAIATIDTLRQQALGKPAPDVSKEYMQNIFRASYSTIPLIAPFIDLVLSKTESGIWGHDLTYPALQTINEAGKAVADGIKGNEEQAMKESLDFTTRIMGVPNFPLRVAKKIAE